MWKHYYYGSSRTRVFTLHVINLKAFFACLTFFQKLSTRNSTRKLNDARQDEEKEAEEEAIFIQWLQNLFFISDGG